jgi:acetylornithine deacetylase/succinyl-diaminopimelate desuccinylase-like protein
MDPCRLLAELIALPSVNPAFLPAGHPHAGERRVAECLLSVAARAGLDVELRPVVADRANLLVRLAPAGRVRQRVLLAPHLDTVGADDHQFRPVLKASRVYGRGACDTKGSVAAMLSALIAVAQSGRRPRGTEIIFAGLVDEENAQRGSRALAASGLKADLAIVGEPTGLQVVTAHKGDLWLRLETRGRAAHGATPHLGRNAVHTMARVVDLLETDYAASLQRRRHPLLGRPTVNVGAIRGGSQPNIVPDHCALEVDRRTLPGETTAGVMRALRTFLRQRGLAVTVADSKGEPCPALETNPRLPLVRQLMAVAGQTQPAGVQFFCDAAILAGGGIPSVVFGPGDIAQAHTADEWVSLRQVEQATARLRRLLEERP